MDAKTRAIFRKAMREIGRKGGRIGGKRSLETMTSEERTARAKKASLVAAKKRTAARLARENRALREVRKKYFSSRERLPAIGGVPLGLFPKIPLRNWPPAHAVAAVASGRIRPLTS